MVTSIRYFHYSAVWIIPTIDDFARTTFGTGLMLLSAIAYPNNRSTEEADTVPRITWNERDVGERFSMVMFHLVILLGIAFFAWTLATSVEGWVGDVLAAALICAGIWLAVKNWKRRNAR